MLDHKEYSLFTCLLWHVVGGAVQRQGAVLVAAARITWLGGGAYNDIITSTKCKIDSIKCLEFDTQKNIWLSNCQSLYISPALPGRSALIGPVVSCQKRRRGRNDSEHHMLEMEVREGEGLEVRRGRRKW